MKGWGGRRFPFFLPYVEKKSLIKLAVKKALLQVLCSKSLNTPTLVLKARRLGGSVFCSFHRLETGTVGCRLSKLVETGACSDN